MPAEASLRDGDLQGALAQLQEQVRNDPGNAMHRVFLFQLYSVLGVWGRALTQLEVAGDLDASNLAMVQTYREVLRCEALREEVFSGRRSPMVFGDPEQWMALCLQALGCFADGNFEEARQLRNQAYEAAPAAPGTVDDDAFDWIADADDRIGPFLEAIVNGTYYWIPFHRISRLDLEQPEDLRDLVWAPAHFTWSNGGQAVGFVPARYPGSASHSDTQIQLARKTEWIDRGFDNYMGYGQRMLATNQSEYSLLNIRHVDFHTAEN